MTKLNLLRKIICYVCEKYCPLEDDQFKVGLQSKHTKMGQIVHQQEKNLQIQMC